MTPSDQSKCLCPTCRHYEAVNAIQAPVLTGQVPVLDGEWLDEEGSS